jgi:uncharacterized protein (DUF488 family)
MIYTIGHSNHPIDRFIDLLRGAGIGVVLDVRSIPQSRHFPWFGRHRFEAALAAAGIGYIYMGELLGGRPKDPATRRDGVIDYDLIAATPSFQAGLARVTDEAGRRRVALMCAEKAPLDCHRTILVARHLAARGQDVTHLLADGARQPHAAIEEELLTRYAPADDLLTTGKSRTERLAAAYRTCGLQMMRAKSR